MKNIPSLRLRNFSLEASGRLEMDTALGGYLDSFTGSGIVSGAGSPFFQGKGTKSRKVQGLAIDQRLSQCGDDAVHGLMGFFLADTMCTCYSGHEFGFCHDFLILWQGPGHS